MTTGLKKLGLTPAKAVLLAVLAIGMGVVWIPQFMGGSTVAVRESSPSPQPSRPQSPRRQGGQGARPVAQSVAPTAERELPTISLADAASYDPFAVPGWSPRANRTANGAPIASAPAEVERRFDELKATGVGMILVSGGGKAAQIGDRTLHVGDEIDGFRVVEITDSDVVFRPAGPIDGGARGL